MEARSIATEDGIVEAFYCVSCMGICLRLTHALSANLQSGHQPAVVVWEAATGTCISDMKSHKYGVSCVQFSPNGESISLHTRPSLVYWRAQFDCLTNSI
jgi:WD40 repeat protein